MLIYSTVKELVDELNAGSIVLIPSNLLNVMSEYLSPLLLESSEERSKKQLRLLGAPFYVLEVPLYVTVSQETMSRSEFEAKLGLELKVHDKVSIKPVSLRFSNVHSNREVKVLPSSMLNSAYRSEVERTIKALCEKHRSVLVDRPVFLYTKSTDLEIIKELSQIGIYKGVRTYVAVPIRLDVVDSELVDTIKALINDKDKRNVALLLGFEPYEVTVETGNKRTEVRPVTRYLIEKIVEEVLPAFNRPRLAFGLYEDVKPDVVATHIVHKLINMRIKGYAEDLLPAPLLTASKRQSQKGEENPWLVTPQSLEHLQLNALENTYSVSTVFLDTLRSVVSGNAVLYSYSTDRFVFPHIDSESLARNLFVGTLSSIDDRLNNLARYAELVGATKETIEGIKEAKTLLSALQYSDARYRERKRLERAKHIHEEEEVSA